VGIGLYFRLVDKVRHQSIGRVVFDGPEMTEKAVPGVAMPEPALG
jgi:hypothetical protein